MAAMNHRLLAEEYHYSLTKWLRLLYGVEQADEQLKKFFRTIAFRQWFILLFAVILLLQGDPAAAGFIGSLAVALPMISAKMVYQAWQKRVRLIVADLPALLHKLTIYLHAGDPLRHAFVRSIQGTQDTQKYDSSQRPLLHDLEICVRQLHSGVPFSQVLSGLSQRLTIHEVMTFCHLLMSAEQKGAAVLMQALGDWNQQIWQKRRNDAKAASEETTVRMIFPLIFVFAALMAVVAAPAWLTFSHW